MNVTITNINNDTLAAIETLLKPFIEKNKMQIIRDDKQESITEAEEMLKSGNYPVYKSLEEYKKAMGV